MRGYIFKILIIFFLKINFCYSQNECQIFNIIIDTIDKSQNCKNIKYYIVDSLFPGTIEKFNFNFGSALIKIEDFNKFESRTNNLKKCIMSKNNSAIKYIRFTDLDPLWHYCYNKSFVKDTNNKNESPPYENSYKGSLSESDTIQLVAILIFHSILYLKNKLAITYVYLDNFSNGVSSQIWGFVFENFGRKNKDVWRLKDFKSVYRL